MRGRGIHSGVAPLLRLAALAGAAAALGAFAGCGSGEARQDAGIEDATYEARVVEAELERVQRLAKTTLMRIGVRNTGEETIPNLVLTVEMLGEQGRGARQAFAYRNPQENLSRPDRPVWILELGYPVRVGTRPTGPAGKLGGTATASPQVFALGEVAPGELAGAVWRLTPVKAGTYRLSYEVAPDIYGVGSIEGPGGKPLQGRLAARILEAPQRLRVTGDGRVVPIDPDP